LTRDEGNRADTTLEGLASLKPVRGDGHTVTAGNASQLSDGASARVLLERNQRERRRHRHRASVRHERRAHDGQRVTRWSPCASTAVCVRPGGSRSLEHRQAGTSDVLFQPFPSWCHHSRGTGAPCGRDLPEKERQSMMRTTLFALACVALLGSACSGKNPPKGALDGGTTAQGDGGGENGGSGNGSGGASGKSGGGAGASGKTGGGGSDGEPMLSDGGVVPDLQCKRFGDPCDSGADCCSGVCDGKSHSCGSAIASCSAAGEACSAATDC
jgi:hypothetical protein